MSAAARMLRRFAVGVAAVVTIALSPAAAAAFHLFGIEQIYSNADGTVQFVVLHERLNANGEHFWAGQRFTSTHAGVSKFITFDKNLPSSATAGRRVLLATKGFADLGIVAPDFEIPAGFLAIDGGTLNYANVDFVSYASLPTDGVSAILRNGQIVPNVATNFAGASGSVPAPPAAPKNHQGLWWRAPAGSESGWGVNFAHQGDVIFATWFTYGPDGKPTWFIVLADKAGDNVYAGPVSSVTGPRFDAEPFDPAQVVETIVGQATISFAADGASATFAYTVDGIAQVKPIVRHEFASPVPACAWGGDADLPGAVNFQDLWWRSPAASESGWGINFTHQGNTIFATWFTYGADGKPTWFIVLADRTAPGVYAGPVSTVTGPPFNAEPFDPALVAETIVGSATITFADGNSGTLDYTIGDVHQVKPITRNVFVAPGTVCR